MFGAELTAAEPAVDVTVLHAKIGELTLADDFLAGALGKAGLLPSAKRRSAVVMRCRWSPRRSSSVSAAAASTICLGPWRTPAWRSCVGSTSCTRFIRSRAAGCCATCSGSRA